MSCGDDDCISQCELAGTCNEMPFEQYPALEATREQWSASCPAEPQTSPVPFVVEGECEDGKHVLYRGGGYTTERRYFDAVGKFIGLSTTTDVSDDRCMGKGYWPKRIKCDEPKVTQVFCGNWLKVGDSL